MPLTISTNRLSTIKYDSGNAAIIRSLSCLTGFCTLKDRSLKIEYTDILKETIDNVTHFFDHGFTVFATVGAKEEIILTNGVNYNLSMKASDANDYSDYGILNISSGAFAGSESITFTYGDVLLIHQTERNVFTLCNVYTNYEILSSSSHQNGKSYLVNGSGYSGTPTKFLKEDGTWEVPANTTYNTLSTGNHASGTNYVVNGIGPTVNTNKYLRSDGTWEVPTNTTYTTLDTNSHASGTNYVVNGPGDSTNTFLRGDGTWQTPENTTYAALATNAHATNTTYVVKGSGYSGTPTKFLKEDGTWQTPENTTYETLSASSHANGTSYLVNGIGATTSSTRYLRSDGTWAKPTNTTYAALTTNAHSSEAKYVVIGPGDSTNTFLRGDGSWQTPENTTYETLSTSSHASGTGYLVNGIGSTVNTNKYLRSDGTWEVPTDTTYGTLSTSASLHATNKSYTVKGSGYSSNPSKFLREDGSWESAGSTYATLSPNSHANGTGYLVNGVGAATNTALYLRNDGNWTQPTNTTYAVLSTNSHATNSSYTVQGSGYTSNPSKFLKEDGSWENASIVRVELVPAGTEEDTYTIAADSNRNVHIAITSQKLSGVNMFILDTNKPSNVQGFEVTIEGGLHLVYKIGSDYYYFNEQGQQVQYTYGGEQIYNINWQPPLPIDEFYSGDNNIYFKIGNSTEKRLISPNKSYNGQIRNPLFNFGSEYIVVYDGTNFVLANEALISSSHDITTTVSAYVAPTIEYMEHYVSYEFSNGQVFSTANNGFVPKPASSQASASYVLTGDGTWSQRMAIGLINGSTNSTIGMSMPLVQSKSVFPTNYNVVYTGANPLYDVIMPIANKIWALPIEISKDGIVYVPISDSFGHFLVTNHQFVQTLTAI